MELHDAFTFSSRFHFKTNKPQKGSLGNYRPYLTSELYLLLGDNAILALWNELDFKVQEVEKANGTENTSGWFKTS